MMFAVAYRFILILYVILSSFKLRILQFFIQLDFFFPDGCSFPISYGRQCKSCDLSEIAMVVQLLLLGAVEFDLISVLLV